jgi:hypothetical protein
VTVLRFSSWLFILPLFPDSNYVCLFSEQFINIYYLFLPPVCLLEQMDPSERDGGSRKSNKPKCNFYSPATLSPILSAKSVFQEIDAPLLADSKFSQQELPACKPLLTPKLVTIPATNLFDLQIYIFAITHQT